MTCSYWSTIAVTMLLRLVNPLSRNLHILGPVIRFISLIVFAIAMPFSHVHGPISITAINAGFGVWLFFCDRCLRTKRTMTHRTSSTVNDQEFPQRELQIRNRCDIGIPQLPIEELRM